MNFRARLEKLARANALAYYENLQIMPVKSFITMGSGEIVIKLFCL
jgi:hypothetical protein